jgi:hypothetical protein
LWLAIDPSEAIQFESKSVLAIGFHPIQSLSAGIVESIFFWALWRLAFEQEFPLLHFFQIISDKVRYGSHSFSKRLLALLSL